MKVKKHSKNGKIKWISTAVLESVADEQYLWIRKLIEILIDQINFSSNNFSTSFRAYLSLENLELFLGKQRDYRTYFKIPYLNIESTIGLFKDRVMEDINSLPKEQIWFIRWENFNKNAIPLFTTVKSRFDKALKIAKPIENMILGRTYGTGYSLASNSLHRKAGSSEMEVDKNLIKNNSFEILLLSYAILNRSCELLGLTNEYVFKLDSSSLVEIAVDKNNLFKKELTPGDMAFAYDYLVEILEKYISDFGYISYKVRYLATPLLSEIKEDYYPSKYITPLVGKKDVRKYFDSIKNPDSLARIIDLGPDINDDKLFELIKSNFIDLAKNNKLKEFLRSLLADASTNTK